MESTLQIMPVQRISRNFGEYAEEADLYLLKPIRLKPVWII